MPDEFGEPDEDFMADPDPANEGDVVGGSTPAVTVSPTKSSDPWRPRFSALSWTPSGDGTGTVTATFREGRSVEVLNVTESEWDQWGLHTSSPGRAWPGIAATHAWHYI